MSSSDLTPAALGKHPIALTLPDELWIKILHHLGYKQLKRTARICKKLQGFIRGTEFDRVLYRAGPRTPAYGKAKPVFLHPIIGKTDGIFAKLEDARMLVWEGDDDKEFFPKDYPTILDEFATRPASTQIVIEIEDAPRERLPPLIRSDGVTVRDFFEHLAKFWSTPVSAKNAEYAMAEFGIKNAKDVNYTHILGAHYAWTSWMGGIAQGGNRTKVTAGPFDS